MEQEYSAISNELLVDDFDSRDGVEVLNYIRFLEDEISAYSKILNCSNNQVLKKITQIKEENIELNKVLGNQTSEFKTFENCIDALEGLVALNKSLQRESKEIQSQDIGSSVESLISNSLAVEGYELITNIFEGCLLYTSPSPRDKRQSRMPSSA